jgi:hypothetical protein
VSVREWKYIQNFCWLRLSERHRHRWENNNGVEIGEVWDDSVDWINLAEEKV